MTNFALTPDIEQSELDAVFALEGQPIRVEQGTADTTVFPFTTDALVTEYQGRHNPVSYKKYNGVSHGGIVISAASDSLKFLKSHR